MNERKSNGCAIAAGVSALLVLMALAILVFGIRGCVSVVHDARHEARMEAREAREHARAVGVEPEDGVILFDDELPRPEPHRKGAPLARESWLAWSLDDRATQYAREAFREAADGSPVDWMLRTEEVFQSGGAEPRGMFGLPVRVERREGNSTRVESRTITVDVEFGSAKRERLMSVRKGDWVRVAGRLSVRGEELRIVDARIVDEAEDLPVER